MKLIEYILIILHSFIIPLLTNQNWRKQDNITAKLITDRMIQVEWYSTTYIILLVTDHWNRSLN